MAIGAHWKTVAQLALCIHKLISGKGPTLTQDIRCIEESFEWQRSCVLLQFRPSQRFANGPCEGVAG